MVKNLLMLTIPLKKSHKAPKLRVDNRVRVTKHKNIFSRYCIKNLSKKTFVIDSVLKTNKWTNNIKDLNGEKIIESFYEKELLLSKL